MCAKPIAVITENHLYGFGGGAQAVLKVCYALDKLGYDVRVCGKRPIAVQNLQELGRMGVMSRAYYRGCSKGADLLVNIDHAGYESPMAKLNLAHIFHPYKGNFPGQHVDLTKYRFSANSQYTSKAIAEKWKLNAPALYIPINRTFYQARKRPVIMHVSRFSRPNEVADKGHAEMIRAFQSMVDAGLDGWEFVLAGSLEDSGFANELRMIAQKYPISLLTNPSDDGMAQLYSQAAIYWHATGISMPDISSAQEHLGLTTIEAMASGCVPVVLGTGGQVEILAGTGAGMLVRDQRDLAQGTLDLIGNMSRWADMQQRALLVAEPWQDHEAWVERMAAWIEDAPIPELPPVKWRTSKFKPSDVTVVVPVLNGSDYTRDMLRTLLGTEPEVGKIVVVDNGSTDHTKDVLKNVLRSVDVVVHRKNDNYAAANMAALEHINTPLVLAANNDLVFMEVGWLGRMCEAMQDYVGIVGAKLLFPDGKLQHAGGSIDWNRPDIGYHRWYQQEDAPGSNQIENVNFVTGALLLCRRGLWNWSELGGGFNYEDADLCLSAKQSGWRVVYQPSARAVHYQGVTKGNVEGAEDNFTDSASATRKNADAFIAKWYKRSRDEQPQWRLERDPNTLS